MQETVIELSKKKLILILLGALVFVAIGAWMLWNAETITSGPQARNPVVVYSIGVISILFFGLAAIMSLRKLLDKTPGLTLTGESLIDNSSGISGEPIPWNEVTAIEERQIQRQKLISIHVLDPEKYIDQASTWKKMALRANMKMTGTPIGLSSNSLKIKHDDLLKLLRQYVANQHS